MGVFIAPYEICLLAAGKGRNALPVDRPTVKNLTVAPTGRPGLDPESNGSLAGRPPGRPEPDTESRALCRSTARSTWAISREQSSLAVDRVGRPAHQQSWRARSVHVGRLARSTDFKLDRPVRSTDRSQVRSVLGLKRLSFWLK